MSNHTAHQPFALFGYPYEELTRLPRPHVASLGRAARPGTALVWSLAPSPSPSHLDVARNRPPGMALIAILPPAEMIESGVDVLTVVDRCKPHSVLPFHPEPDPEDLTRVLQRPPEALSVEVSDYLSWRGIRMDGDTRRMIRRTIDLSGELRTVSGLARALYVSRRALGRRFLKRGLPAPSHWLQFGRALRAAVRLQTSNDSLFTVAADLGYPDGFALSNQMKRLTGVRPTQARSCLGWEWFVEAWLRKERQAGHFGSGPPRTTPAKRVAESHKPVPERLGRPAQANEDADAPAGRRPA